MKAGTAKAEACTDWSEDSIWTTEPAAQPYLVVLPTSSSWQHSAQYITQNQDSALIHFSTNILAHSWTGLDVHSKIHYAHIIPT